MKYVDPYEILTPCRSRVITGAVVIAVVAVLIFILSR
jgi:hypothetical protein